MAAGQVEVGLVEQGGRAERQVGPASGQLAPGHAVQLVVQGGEGGLGRRRIAAVGRRQQIGQRGVHPRSLRAIRGLSLAQPAACRVRWAPRDLQTHRIR